MPQGPTRSSVKKAQKTVIAAMVLAWATQTLVSQWASGAEPTAQTSADSEGVVTITMRESASVGGTSVRLADVCRLAGDDGSLGRLTLAYRETSAKTLSVGVEQVIRVLGEAGVGPARVRFQGPILCEVSFTDAAPAIVTMTSQEAALLEWAGEPAPAKPVEPVKQPAPRVVAETTVAVEEDTVSWGEMQRFDAADAEPLADVLRRDLATRLGLDESAIDLRFRDPSADILMLKVAPGEVRPTRASDLGPVSWAVEVAGRSVTVSADAAARVSRLTVSRPIGRGQVIRADDVILESATIRRLADKGLGLAEVVGQEAARTLGVGDVLKGDSLAPRLLVRRGQYVSLALVSNGVELRTLARALDDGGYGQSVKLRNDTTGEILHAVVTGPQSGTLADVTRR